ncbi:MAG TPA: phosphoribosylanthranilate isomerase [Rhizomicrobium sp.]|nr:phosphoribosylanthranilate isomerase [Rhizomicrobium sp.]
MGVLIKICGINSVEAADAACGAGADFAGLVFYSKSPRNLMLDQARALSARMRGRTRLVALFADAADDEIGTAIKLVEPDFVQLHGSEPPARVADIRARFGVKAIKAFAIAQPSDFACIAGYDADMLLFDAKPADGAARPGGHGAAFDWQLLRGRSFSRPWLLAGGLSAQNVARAVGASGAPGVDVSSGVETAPGIKSARMIGEFVRQARA